MKDAAVRQGSWKTKVVSKTAWFVATGLAFLLISGWSILIQKELEAHNLAGMRGLSGLHEVDLAADPKVPPILQKT